MKCTPDERHKVLVADDNTDGAMLLEEAFANLGGRITWEHLTSRTAAQNLLRGWNILGAPALIIMDDLLPGMRGSDLVDVMVRDPGFGSPRVVLVSGQTQAGLTGGWADLAGETRDSGEMGSFGPGPEQAPPAGERTVPLRR